MYSQKKKCDRNSAKQIKKLDKERPSRRAGKRELKVCATIENIEAQSRAYARKRSTRFNFVQRST
jgi:hypothetical protein